MSRNVKSLFTGPHELAVVKLEDRATFYISKKDKEGYEYSEEEFRGSFPSFSCGRLTFILLN